MKTIFNKDALAILSERIKALEFNDEAKWGHFTAARMICHLQDQISYALGKKSEEKDYVSGPPPRFVRLLMLHYIPWPKGKIQTGKNMLDTKSGEFVQDKARVIQLLTELYEAREKTNWPFHPFFGSLNGKTWAKLVWKHTDFHLRQFGV